MAPRQNGGYFHENLEIRVTDPTGDPSSSSSSYGILATGTIPPNATLMEIPRHLLVAAGTGDHCDTVHWLAEQMADNGSGGSENPYIRCLQEQPTGQLPSAWSDAGKEALVQILGTELPPHDVVGLRYEDDCGWNSNNSSSNNVNAATVDAAYMLLMQRGWDDVLIPVFHLLSHRNDNPHAGSDSSASSLHLNTVHDTVHDPDRPVAVRSARHRGAGAAVHELRPVSGL
jgi:hypothetical protein